MEGNKSIKIKCYGNNVEAITGTLSCGTEYSLKHINGDPSSVYRFYLSGKNFSLEITPSKGLSVRDFYYYGRQFFWNAPMDSLPDPEKIDLEGVVIINGEPVKGTRWLEYFASHVEMLGSDNWGVPVEKDGRILGLHGNASSIPVTEIILEEKKDRIIISGSFFVYDPNKVFPDNDTIDPYFEVEKKIELNLEKSALLIKDRITNVSNTPRFPDWGYHVQLRPEAGCRYLVPSKEVKERDGNIPKENFELWKEAVIPEDRMERGFIHKNLLITERCFPDGTSGVETLLQYNDGSGIKCIIPPSPYTLSWFSCGGGNGTEFLIPGKEDSLPEKMLQKNWDGVGPEVGASALDHDGDTDPAFTQSMLDPEQSTEIQICLELLEKEPTEKLLKQIEDYNKNLNRV